MSTDWRDDPEQVAQKADMDQLVRDLRDVWGADLESTERKYIARALIGRGWTNTRRNSA